MVGRPNQLLCEMAKAGMFGSTSLYSRPISTLSMVTRMFASDSTCCATTAASSRPGRAVEV